MQDGTFISKVEKLKRLKQCNFYIDSCMYLQVVEFLGLPLC